MSVAGIVHILGFVKTIEKVEGKITSHQAISFTKLTV